MNKLLRLTPDRLRSETIPSIRRASTAGRFYSAREFDGPQHLQKEVDVLYSPVEKVDLEHFTSGLYLNESTIVEDKNV